MIIYDIHLPLYLLSLNQALQQKLGIKEPVQNIFIYDNLIHNFNEGENPYHISILLHRK